MDSKQRVREVMDAMSQGGVAPLFDAMSNDVTWRWMGVNQWSRHSRASNWSWTTSSGVH
jgi:hypothetical protein